MRDTIGTKLIKILAVVLLGSLIGAIIDIWGPLGSSKWVRLINFGRPESISLVNIFSGILASVWIRENIYGKLLYGLLAALLIIPIGGYVGFLILLLVWR